VTLLVVEKRLFRDLPPLRVFRQPPRVDSQRLLRTKMSLLETKETLLESNGPLSVDK
jgi:hypothetical protein